MTLAHAWIRRSLLPPLAALCLVALAPPALAAAPVFHDRIEAHFNDPDFCGSGMAVDVAVSGVQVVRFEDGVFGATGHVRAVITNPDTEASVTVSSAGQLRDEVVSGDPGGLHTHLVTFKGLPEKIQSTGGEVLLRDAGVISFLDTFDGPRLVSSQVVVNRGPHPEADSDFAVFCATVVPALG